MLVGGSPKLGNVEIIDLSGNGLQCVTPADYPHQFGATGIYFDGSPFVCGGYTIPVK